MSMLNRHAGPVTPASCPHHTYAQCKVGDMLLGWRPGIVRCVVRRWKVVFLIESRTREEHRGAMSVPRVPPSFSPSFFAFEQSKQVFGNCCVGKATGVFWNQALSCRGYFCHTSRGFNLLYPTIHSYAAAKMIELNASILYKKVRSKRSRVLQPCLSQSGLGPGLSGQAWLFHTWDSWPPGCD